MTASADAPELPSAWSERSEPKAADRVEMLAVSGDETEAVLQRRRSDERVRKSGSELSSDTTGSLRYCAVDGEFTEGGEQLARQVRGRIAGKELRAGHDRVVEPMSAGDEGDRATEMVDEDVGVDQKISHAATRRATACPRRASASEV